MWSKPQLSNGIWWGEEEKIEIAHDYPFRFVGWRMITSGPLILNGQKKRKKTPAYSGGKTSCKLYLEQKLMYFAILRN